MGGGRVGHGVGIILFSFFNFCCVFVFCCLTFSVLSLVAWNMIIAVSVSLFSLSLFPLSRSYWCKEIVVSFV